MILGVSNVRSNFSGLSLLGSPNGWLLNPKSSLIIFFEKPQNFEKNKNIFYTHLVYANDLGEPSKLKNIREHSIGCATETWNELISAGWTVVTHKFQ